MLTGARVTDIQIDWLPTGGLGREWRGAHTVALEFESAAGGTRIWMECQMVDMTVAQRDAFERSMWEAFGVHCRPKDDPTDLRDCVVQRSDQVLAFFHARPATPARPADMYMTERETIDDLRSKLADSMKECTRYKERLVIDPGGGDKIDELESAMGFLRSEIEQLKDDKEKAIKLATDNGARYEDANGRLKVLHTRYDALQETAAQQELHSKEAIARRDAAIAAARDEATKLRNRIPQEYLVRSVHTGREGEWHICHPVVDCMPDGEFHLAWATREGSIVAHDMHDPKVARMPE